MMRYVLLIFIISGIAVVGICGFRGDHSRRPPIELFPDMVRQNKVRPQTPSDFFPDEWSSRLVPVGAIAHSGPYQLGGEVLAVDGKPAYAYEDAPINTGKIPGTTNWVPLNPLPITRQLLDRGQQRYQINCMPCHGPVGDGKGIVSKYGLVAMANFHDKRLIDMTDGEIFNTITYGKNLMGAYGPNVVVEDRWAIIAYVRALQRSQLATAEDVPAPDRAPFTK